MPRGYLFCAAATAACCFNLSCTKNVATNAADSGTDSTGADDTNTNTDADAVGDSGVDTETADTGASTDVDTETADTGASIDSVPKDDCPPESCEMLDCDAAEGCEGDNIVLYIPYCVCGECVAPSEGIVIKKCEWGCDDTFGPVCLPGPDGGDSD